MSKTTKDESPCSLFSRVKISDKPFLNKCHLFLFKTDRNSRWTECWLSFSKDLESIYIFRDGDLCNDAYGVTPFEIKLESCFKVEKCDKIDMLSLGSLFQFGIIVSISCDIGEVNCEFITTSKQARDWFYKVMIDKESSDEDLKGIKRVKSYFPRHEKQKSKMCRSLSFDCIKKNRPSFSIANLEAKPLKQTIRFFILTWNMAVRKLMKQERSYLEQQIPLDCDVYVFAVQECVNIEYLDFLSALLPHCVLCKTKKDKLFGRGDRSFINPKFTGIGAFVTKKLYKKTEVLSSEIVSIGKFEGSKGSAGMALKINDSTFAFVSSHFPVQSLDYRSTSYQIVDRMLGRSLGNKNFGLFHQFHHVFFMGDYNYKLENIHLATAMELLRLQNLNALRVHDSLSSEIENERSFFHFREPLPLPNFFPTYKKHEERPRVMDSECLDSHYITVFKKPWYKRSAVVEKIPAFTDRILVNSMNDLAGEVRPVCAKKGSSHMYGCFDPDLIGSDHSPVFALFEAEVPSANILVERRTLCLKVLSVKVCNEKQNLEIQPQCIKILFPAPFEDNNGCGKIVHVHCPFNRLTQAPFKVRVHFVMPDEKNVHRKLKKKTGKHCKAMEASQLVDKEGPTESVWTRGEKSLKEFADRLEKVARLNEPKEEKKNRSLSMTSTVEKQADHGLRCSKEQTNKNEDEDQSEWDKKGSNVGSGFYGKPWTELREKNKKANTLKNTSHQDSQRSSELRMEFEKLICESSSESDSGPNSSSQPHGQSSVPRQHTLDQPQVRGEFREQSVESREVGSSKSKGDKKARTRGERRSSLISPNNSVNTTLSQQFYFISQSPKPRNKKAKKFQSITLRWSTKSSYPVYHILVRVQFGKTEGQCSVGVNIEDFIHCRKKVFTEWLVCNGLPLRNIEGEKIKVRFLIDFGILYN